jgi:iron complex transport system substrate-binding protein
VFAVGSGSNLAGRTSACDFPPESGAVPVVGDFGVPSMEKLAAVNPTIVLELALADEAVGARMDRLGLNRRRIPCNRLADIPTAVRSVGGLLGRADSAEAIATGIEEQVAALRAGLPPEAGRPTVFVEVWHDPVTTAGKESFVADLVELAGGRNIGNESPTPYYTVSSEWVIARNPDVIITLYMAGGTKAPTVAGRAGWLSVAAVRNGRVHGNLNNDLVLRPGPRVMEGVRLLKKCMEPVQTR